MKILEAEHLCKSFGQTKVLKDISFSLEESQVLSIIGSSGSGKTTLLRCLNFLEQPDNGMIRVKDKTVFDAANPTTMQESEIRKNRLHFGLVFQSFNLFPQYTALKNVMLAKELLAKERPDYKARKKEIHDEIEAQAVSLLKQMGLSERINNYPHQLSGGQCQRVAIARAIASEPHLLLMDEPLSNLDAKLRVDMRSELKRLHTETGTTMIYVTHDQVEALTMSTKIAIFREGIIIQVAHPLELYNNPANLYVADFIGNPRINFVDGKAEVSASGLTVNSVLGRMTFPADHLKDENMPQEASFDAVLGIRPEQIAINTSRQSPSDIEAHIYTSMPAGSETLVTVKVGGVSMVIKALGITHYNPDQVVYLSIDTTKINVFDKKTENLIKYSVE